MVRYDASEGRTELGCHRDGTLLTVNIALNALSEYQGGGTRFEALEKASSASTSGGGGVDGGGGGGLGVDSRYGQTVGGGGGDGSDVEGDVVKIECGHVLVHPGEVRHAVGLYELNPVETHSLKSA